MARSKYKQRQRARAFQLSRRDERDLREITHSQHVGNRPWILCKGRVRLRNSGPLDPSCMFARLMNEYHSFLDQVERDGTINSPEIQEARNLFLDRLATVKPVHLRVGESATKKSFIELD